MKKELLILVILLLIQTFAKEDVCIIGGGASGMSAAVFLKDRGYNVVVLEKDDRVGGHCDTSYFPAPAGQQNWVELGVVVFPDTKKENDTGMGSWTVGSRQFAQRFLAPDGTFPYIGGAPTYGFDFTFLFSAGLIPQNPPTPDFIAAFIRYNTILATQYPWVENANIPDPIPAILLRPFGEFIDANNLQPLAQLFQGLLMFGGMGNYRSVTTLYALQNLRRGVVNVYTDPSYGFAIKGGCQKIYDGMVNYIESKNIFLNTNILSVRRYGTEDIEIKYKQNYTNNINTMNCKNIIISFPQLLTKLSFLDLTVEEIGIFSNVRANYYYNYRVDADGPITVGSPYTLASINILNPDTLLFPNILAIKRDTSFGPAAGYAYSETDIDEILMYNFVKLKLSLVPNSLLTNINVTVFDQHLYQAHFTNFYLSQTPSPYTRLNNLQGKKNTYWAGALFSFAETASIWQKTYDLVNQYFPPKK